MHPIEQPLNAKRAQKQPNLTIPTTLSTRSLTQISLSPNERLKAFQAADELYSTRPLQASKSLPGTPANSNFTGISASSSLALGRSQPQISHPFAATPKGNNLTSRPLSSCSTVPIFDVPQPWLADGLAESGAVPPTLVSHPASLPLTAFSINPAPGFTFGALGDSIVPFSFRFPASEVCYDAALVCQAAQAAPCQVDQAALRHSNTSTALTWQNSAKNIAPAPGSRARGTARVHSAPAPRIFTVDLSRSAHAAKSEVCMTELLHFLQGIQGLCLVNVIFGRCPGTKSHNKTYYCPSAVIAPGSVYNKQF